MPITAEDAPRRRFEQAADEQELVNRFPSLDPATFGARGMDHNAPVFRPSAQVISRGVWNVNAAVFVPRSVTLIYL